MRGRNPSFTGISVSLNSPLSIWRVCLVVISGSSSQCVEWLIDVSDVFIPLASCVCGFYRMFVFPLFLFRFHYVYFLYFFCLQYLACYHFPLYSLHFRNFHFISFRFRPFLFFSVVYLSIPSSFIYIYTYFLLAIYSQLHFLSSHPLLFSFHLVSYIYFYSLFTSSYICFPFPPVYPSFLILFKAYALT